MFQWLTDFGGIPSRFCGDVAEVVFEEYFDVLVYVEVLYVLLVYYGPKWMENRPAFNLKVFAIFWNLLLSLYALGGAIVTVKLMVYNMRNRGFYQTTCFFDKHVVYDGEYAFWIFTFLLSKIPEMMDTVMLVLQKKPIIFLHWYHHLTVTIFCWYAGYSLIPSGLWFATMNYMVHAPMYGYYFFCSIGLRKLVRPFAPFITGSQLLQMVIGTVIVVYTYYMSYISERGCAVDRRTIRMGLMMYGSYVGLFALLFAKLYLIGGGKDAKRKPKKAIDGVAVDGATNGSSVKNGTNGAEAKNGSGEKKMQ